MLVPGKPFSDPAVEEALRPDDTDSLEIMNEKCEHGTKALDQLAKQLSAIHSEGLTHSDLKPQNALVSIGSSIEANLIDFGASYYCFESGRQDDAFFRFAHVKDWFDLPVLFDRIFDSSTLETLSNTSESAKNLYQRLLLREPETLLCLLNTRCVDSSQPHSP